MDQAEMMLRRGIRAKGRKELAAHLEGIRLTQRQAIQAKCYECMGAYSDGRVFCKIPKCPLSPFMPYRDSGKKE